MVTKRIEPLSLGKVAGVLYGAMGLIVGVIVSLAATIGGLAGHRPGGSAVWIAVVRLPPARGRTTRGISVTGRV